MLRERLLRNQSIRALSFFHLCLYMLHI